jgi:hypothetical protein
MNNIFDLKITIPKIELIKNNHYDILINYDSTVKSVDNIKENNSSDSCIITIDSFDDEDDQKIIKKRKIKKSKCPGCYPIFQENQLGHIGLNGCLGDEY